LAESAIIDRIKPVRIFFILVSFKDCIYLTP